MLPRVSFLWLPPPLFPGVAISAVLAHFHSFFCPPRPLCFSSLVFLLFTLRYEPTVFLYLACMLACCLAVFFGVCVAIRRRMLLHFFVVICLPPPPCMRARVACAVRLRTCVVCFRLSPPCFHLTPFISFVTHPAFSGPLSAGCVVVVRMFRRFLFFFFPRVRLHCI